MATDAPVTRLDGRRFRIAVDTGGTFTDVVVSDDSGRTSAGKALTTYGRVFDGFSAAVGKAGRAWSATAEEVLAASDVVVYGTTHATNAVVTGRTARTALIINTGLVDTLLLREGGRRNVFDSKVAYPPPYVPRALTFGIGGRLTAEGEVLEPLDDGAVRGVIAEIAALEVEAVAVTLLWSIVNPEQELRVGELLEELMPGVPVTLSHRANPSIREYRRASAASIDASLKPLMARHLGDLLADCRAAGFERNLLVVTSEGAVLDVDQVLSRPVLTLNSGPSMAPLVGAKSAPNADVVVVCDMGGTTFDVSLVQGGRIQHTREAWLGEPFIGHLTGLSSVAVQSIGAGGGSIAWIDGGGLLRVGPQSARSEPGPACYGRGGDQPTVTDACLVLGYLNPDTFGAGFSLDTGAATKAIDGVVGAPLGLSTQDAAQAIIDISVMHMAEAIRQTTLEHGIDPRGATVVCGGGAGAMVAAAIAGALDAGSVVIPAAAGVLAAYGAHDAPIATEVLVAAYTDTGALSVEGLGTVLDRLDAGAAEFMARFDTVATPAEVHYFFDARYPSQAWDLRVHLDERPPLGTGLRSVLENAFHSEHDRRNGTFAAGSRVEILTWGIRVEIARQAGGVTTWASAEATAQAAVQQPVRFGGATVTAPRIRSSSLGPGSPLSGPAIIDDDTTTIVIPPGWSAQLDGERNVVLTRVEAQA